MKVNGDLNCTRSGCGRCRTALANQSSKAGAIVCAEQAEGKKEGVNGEGLNPSSNPQRCRVENEA